MQITLITVSIYDISQSFVLWHFFSGRSIANEYNKARHMQQTGGLHPSF